MWECIVLGQRVSTILHILGIMSQIAPRTWNMDDTICLWNVSKGKEINQRPTGQTSYEYSFDFLTMTTSDISINNTVIRPANLGAKRLRTSALLPFAISIARTAPAQIYCTCVHCYNILNISCITQRTCPSFADTV